MQVTTPYSRIYLTQTSPTGPVFLNVTPLLLRYSRKPVLTYAILDNGAQRSIILPAAVRQLGIKGRKETMALRTIHYNVAQLEEQPVNF